MSDITFEPPPIAAKDAEGRSITSLIRVDGSIVGHYCKMKYGPGYLVAVYGTKWQNAPGARYPQELDFKADYTYVRTKAAMAQRVRQALHDRSTSSSGTGISGSDTGTA